jgi:hypothetical protein
MYVTNQKIIRRIPEPEGQPTSIFFLTGLLVFKNVTYLCRLLIKQRVSIQNLSLTFTNEIYNLLFL